MYVAETIMMTRSTSTTSTIGVTLMPTMGPRGSGSVRCRPWTQLSVGESARRLVRRGRRWSRASRTLSTCGSSAAPRARAPRRSAPASLPRTLNVGLDLADLLLHDVVGDDGREGDEEADAGRDERLGDAAHDVAHRGLVLAGVAELVEGLDDADDRAEEADERRVVAERAEKIRGPHEAPARSRQRRVEGVGQGARPPVDPSQRASGRCPPRWSGSRAGRGGQVEILDLEGLGEARRERVEVVAMARGRRSIARAPT